MKLNLNYSSLLILFVISISFNTYAAFTVDASIAYPPDAVDSGAVTGELIGTIPYINHINAKGRVVAGESLELDFKDSADFQFKDDDNDIDISSSTFNWYCFRDTPEILITELKSAIPPALSELITANRAKLLSSNFDVSNQVSKLPITQTIVNDPDCEYIGFAITPKSETGYPERENSTLIVPSVNFIGSIDVNRKPDYIPMPMGNPLIENLVLTGQMREGFALTATYDFTPDMNDHQPQNRSVYSYGEQSTTASQVMTSAQLAGETPVLGENSFTLPILTAEQINTVLEVSVLAKDGRGATGNTLTVNTDMPIDQGNKVIGLPITFTFTATPNEIVANGKDTSTLVLTAQDKLGNFVPNITSQELSVSLLDDNNKLPDVQKVVLASLVEDTINTGHYTSTIKGTLAGIYGLTPIYNATQLTDIAQTIKLNADKSTASLKMVWLNSTDLVRSNGQDLNNIQLTLVDANNNPFPNDAIDLTLPTGVTLNNVTSPITMDTNGVATFSVKSTNEGILSINGKSQLAGATGRVDVRFTPENFILNINLIQ